MVTPEERLLEYKIQAKALPQYKRLRFWWDAFNRDREVWMLFETVRQHPRWREGGRR